MHRTLPLMLLLTGCGSSLYGEHGLGLLVGEEPPSSELAWELRWVQPADGLVLGCDLEPTSALGEQEGLPFGFLEVDSPTQVVPAAWNDVAGGRFALALPTLLDREASVERSSAAAPFAGVWGISAYQAYLVVEGDGAAVANALDIPLSGEERTLAEGVHLVDLWTDPVVDTGTMVGAVFLFDSVVPLALDGDEGPLALVALDETTDNERAVWSGEALGGLDGCP